jgi:hypothetical protein
MQFCKKWIVGVALAVLAALTCMSYDAQATGLLANWTLNDTPGIGATILDATGNGHNGTIAGTDTLTSVPGVIGNGLSFSGAAVTTNYITVPNTTGLGGMNTLTLSAWVNIPAAAKVTSERMVFNMWDTGTQVYEFGTKYSGLATARGLYARADTSGTDYQNSKSFWDRTDGSGWIDSTWELLTFVYYGGTDYTAVSFVQMYVNGTLVRSYQWGLGSGNGARPLPSPAPGQEMRIGVGNREWYGGLNDLSIWNVNLTGPYAPMDYPWTAGTTGGEISAMYKTPMYNNHTGALSQYGAKAMDKLFTLYESANVTTATVVTTSDGTLAWKYVSSGLTAGSGEAGQLANGRYFVQLDKNGGDTNGGGVESLLSGDANLDDKVDINDLTKVLTSYNQSTGVSWTNGDFNNDGRVDINDLTIVLTHYNQSYSAAASGLAAVPEPDTLALLAAGLVGLLACAWRARR